MIVDDRARLFLYGEQVDAGEVNRVAQLAIDNLAPCDRSHLARLRALSEGDVRRSLAQARPASVVLDVFAVLTWREIEVREPSRVEDPLAWLASRPRTFSQVAAVWKSWLGAAFDAP